MHPQRLLNLHALVQIIFAVINVRAATDFLNTQRVLETVHVALQIKVTICVNTDPVQRHHLHHRSHQIIHRLEKILQHYQMKRYTFQYLSHHLNYRQNPQLTIP